MFIINTAKRKDSYRILIIPSDFYNSPFWLWTPDTNLIILTLHRTIAGGMLKVMHFAR